MAFGGEGATLAFFVLTNDTFCFIVVGVGGIVRAKRSSIWWLRVWCASALLQVSLLLLPVPGKAQDWLPCGDGVELRLSSRKPIQGGLVLVEVHSALPFAELKAEWFGQTLRFWRESNSENAHRALLGVDLEQPAGVFPLTIDAELESGERLGCSVLVSVQEGRFAVERLRVARRFVELSPRDLERAQREGQRLRGLFAKVNPERVWQGEFRLPLDRVEGAGNFGHRRVLNDQPRSPHSGEDFPAPAGTPVRAAQRGRVVLAEELFFAGNSVVLDHGLGLYTFYGHLELIAVEQGAMVEAGAFLGRLGATGRATGAHLHWGVRLNQARVNPRDLVVLLSD